MQLTINVSIILERYTFKWSVCNSRLATRCERITKLWQANAIVVSCRTNDMIYCLLNCECTVRVHITAHRKHTLAATQMVTARDQFIGKWSNQFCTNKSENTPLTLQLTVDSPKLIYHP